MKMCLTFNKASAQQNNNKKIIKKKNQLKLTNFQKDYGNTFAILNLKV